MGTKENQIVKDVIFSPYGYVASAGVGIYLLLDRVIFPFAKEVRFNITDGLLASAEGLLGITRRQKLLNHFISSNIIYRTSQGVTRFKVDEVTRKPVFPIVAANILNIVSFKIWVGDYPSYKALSRSNEQIFDEYQSFADKAIELFSLQARQMDMFTSKQYDEIFLTQIKRERESCENRDGTWDERLNQCRELLIRTDFSTPESAKVGERFIV